MNKKSLLMVLGPTEIESDILALGAEPQVYMRTPEFSLKLKNIFQNLQYVFQTQQPVLIASSSGTGMMEIAVLNALSSQDSVLVVNGGTFGERWAKICCKHNINVIEEKVPLGKSIDPLVIKDKLCTNPNIKAVLLTHNESSTGALTDIRAVGEIVKEFTDTILIIDCVSSLAVEPVEMDNWNIDVVLSCSQKALAIPPGLGFISFSEKALKFAQKSNLGSFNFDIFDNIENWKRNQTPFTPAVSLIMQLEKRLEKIRDEGLTQIQARYKENTNLLRNGLKKFGFETFAQNPANCATAVYTEKYNAGKIIEIMKEKHNIFITPSGGELKNKMFRVGNFGNINKDEIDRFLKALISTIEDIKNEQRISKDELLIDEKNGKK